MNLPLRIARRYLFAKKSTNAINIITGIAVFGLSVGSAALILVLSVFNGFEDLLVGMYSNFDPDIKVSPAQGKTFTVSDSLLKEIYAIDGVEQISQTLEEVAFFEYKDKQSFGTIKGVEDNYGYVINIDSTMREGNFKTREGPQDMAVIGFSMRNALTVNLDDLFATISVHMPKRNPGIFEKPFVSKVLNPGGVFLVQQDFEKKYVLTNLEFVQRLLELRNKVSALEIKIYPGFVDDDIIDQIKDKLGDTYLVQNRYEQEESFFKLMKVEKWLSYAIVGLMMLLIAFNLIGALWMIVLDKRKDIAILKSMGMQDQGIVRVFLFQGMLLSLLGMVTGVVLALSIYGLQKTVGIVTIPGNMSLEAYPISIRLVDFLIVAMTVVLIGLLASFPPALRARRVSALIREE
ncbi:MAG: FtsX-like permease family protein [Saprospiraceae bacterium]|nr:FtsX-like permease family protein [Saprospiraceae bacterium]